LSQPKDISSTERLLDLIRKKKDSAPASREVVQDRTETIMPSAFKTASPKILPFQRMNTVGIDISHDGLRMVMATGSESKSKVLALKKVPLPDHLSRDSNEFIKILRRELPVFLGAKRHKVWVAVFAAQVEIRHIRIPKVTKKQIEDVVYWTVKKEFPFDEKASILDFEVQGEVIDQGIAKISVMVYIVPRQIVENLKDMFSKAGYPLTGISITPFAIQNLFRAGWITAAEETIASLYIGSNYSRIDILGRGNLTMTRDIKAGTNSMVESFVDRYNEKILPTLPASADAMTTEEAKKIVYSLSHDFPRLSEGEKGYGMPSEEIFDLILPALERLVRQVERTFEYYTGTLGYDKVSKIYVSGAIDFYMKIVDYVGSQLGRVAEPLDPLGEQAPPYYQEGRNISSISERMAYAPALGLALADDIHTPNLLFTYRDKDKAASVTRVNRTIFMVFIASVCICAGVFLYQNLVIAQKKSVMVNLDHQLAQFKPQLSKSLILEASTKASQRQSSAKTIRNRYLGMAIISELSALTLPNIQFIHLKMDLAPVRTETKKPQAEDPAKKEPAKAVEETVEIEGLVTGERSILETTLAGYAMALKNSPMFKEIVVQKNIIEQLRNGEALHFVIQMKVGQI
jgi:type IV pilus assembly protein PilM